MRRTDRAAVALALLLAVAAPARAAVDGSPHDLVAQGYDVPRDGGSQDKCTICHAAARAAGRELVAEVPPSLRRQYGPTSLVCFSCHDGITLVAPEADASLTAFHPDSHGHDLAAYRALQELGTELPSLEGEHLECTTCHDPHDNSRRPFLRAPLDEICLLCHAPLAEKRVDEATNRSGNHPLGVDPSAAVLPGMPLQLAGDFLVAFPEAYPLQKGKGSAGTHWDLGGHLLKGAGGDLSCITCHAVHGDEAAPPTAALLTREPVRDVADEFCEGCHRGKRGDGGDPKVAPNPGGTSLPRTYHPCDNDEGNGEGRIVEVRVPEGWPLGGGSPARLLCTSCHRAHGAAAGTELLRPAPEGDSFCEQCHEQLSLEYHHPTEELEGPCADQFRSASGGKETLSCERCHRAHNAGLGSEKERDYVPILRQSGASLDLCSACHALDNPTCSPNTARTASHFLGDPGLVETYDDKNPPLRTEAWPESGLFGRYGGADEKSVICLSCHSFREGSVLSGDKGTARFLLARSGNPVLWAQGGEAAYLCAGCHGLAPGTGSDPKGHTHPLIEGDATKLGRLPIPPITITPGDHVNCDSCHRPHEAVTAGGVYILEVVAGENTDPKAIKPKMNYTALCYGCHDTSKY